MFCWVLDIDQKFCGGVDKEGYLEKTEEMVLLWVHKMKLSVHSETSKCWEENSKILGGKNDRNEGEGEGKEKSSDATV